MHNEVKGDYRSIQVDASSDQEPFKRILMIVGKDDGIRIDYPEEGNKDKILLTIEKGVFKQS